MGIIICQECDHTIDYVEDEKVSTLYAICSGCHGTADEDNI